jgi:hypothetical protein
MSCASGLGGKWDKHWRWPKHDTGASGSGKTVTMVETEIQKVERLCKVEIQK